MAVYDVVAQFSAVDGVSGIVGGMADTLRSFGANTQQDMDKAGGAFSLLGVAAGAGFAAVAAAVEIGVSQFLTVNDAMAKMQVQMGYSDAGMVRLEKSAKGLFNSGLVGNFKDAADAVQKTSKYVKLLSDNDMSHFLADSAGVGKAWKLTPAAVDEMVGRVQAIFKEPDPFKILDMLTVTAQMSGIPLGELESKVEKLAPKFLSAGLSSLGMGGLIVMAAKAGIGEQGLTGLTTAVTAFHNKIMHPDGNFQAALDQLGLHDVAEKVRTNKESMDDALNEVFTKLGQVKDPAKATADAMALFGDSVTKIGGAGVISTFSGFAGVLGGPEGIAGAADKVTAKMQALPETAFGQIKNAITTYLGDAVELVSSYMLQMPNIIATNLAMAWIRVSAWGVSTLATLAVFFANLKKGFEDAWKNVTQVFANAIAPIVVYVNNLVSSVMAALQPLINAIAAAAAGLSAIAGYTGGGGLPEAKGTGVGARRAGGGPLAKNGLTLVGEEGPELIDGSSGMVYSNTQTKTILAGASGGGGGTNITINLDGASIIDVQTFMGTVYKQMQMIDQKRGKRS